MAPSDCHVVPLYMHILGTRPVAESIMVLTTFAEQKLQKRMSFAVK
jgi:hypothetical protein